MARHAHLLQMKFNDGVRDLHATPPSFVGAWQNRGDGHVYSLSRDLAPAYANGAFQVLETPFPRERARACLCTDCNLKCHPSFGTAKCYHKRE